MTGRILNHVELVYAPGERALATAVFELFGCTVSDGGGKFLTAAISPASAQANNVFYASEITPEQQAFEAALTADAGLAGAAAAYQKACRSEPQQSFHFGMRYDDHDAFEAQIAAVKHAAIAHPLLAGRVDVSGVYHPGDPGAYTTRMVQAFLWTDVIASGLLCVGQHFELQWWLGELV